MKSWVISLAQAAAIVVAAYWFANFLTELFYG